MRIHLYTILGLLYTYASAHDQVAFSSGTKRILTPEFSTFVEDIIKDEGIPGYSLAVVRRDGSVELGAWGNMTEDGRGRTTDTLQFIASCSKAFAATAMGLLMDDYASGRNTTPLPSSLDGKRFDWDTKLKDILPDEWKLQDEWASEKASLKDILAHVSGLPRHDLTYGPGDTTEDVVKGLRYLNPHYELRQRWHYNNLMYLTAAEIITKYTGSYTSFVSSRIFKPLNMTSTTFSYTKANDSGNLPHAFSMPFPPSESGKLRRVPHLFGTDEIVEFIAGAGGIISDASDMAKWVAMLMNRGIDPQMKQRIIPESVLTQIMTPHFVIPPETPDSSADSAIVGYGAGWIRTSKFGREVVEHSGSLLGFLTQVSFLPGEGIGFIGFMDADSAIEAHSKIETRVYIDALNLHGLSPDHLARLDSIRSDSHSRAPSPSNLTSLLPIPLSEFAGTYTNLGYGSLTLCAPNSSSFESTYCKQVQSDFSAFPPPENQQTLLSYWPRLRTEHIRMTYMGAGVGSEEWSAEFVTLYSNGYGNDQSKFQTGMYGSVNFVMREGQVAGFELRMEGDRVDAFFAKE